MMLAVTNDVGGDASSWMERKQNIRRDKAQCSMLPYLIRNADIPELGQLCIRGCRHVLSKFANRRNLKKSHGNSACLFCAASGKQRSSFYKSD